MDNWLEEVQTITDIKLFSLQSEAYSDLLQIVDFSESNLFVSKLILLTNGINACCTIENNIFVPFLMFL